MSLRVLVGMLEEQAIAMSWFLDVVISSRMASVMGGMTCISLKFRIFDTRSPAEMGSCCLPTWQWLLGCKLYHRIISITTPYLMGIHREGVLIAQALVAVW